MLRHNMQHKIASHVAGLPRDCLHRTHNIASTEHRSGSLGRRQLALRPEMMPCAIQTAAKHVGGLTTTWQAAVHLTTAACVSDPWEELSHKTNQDRVVQNSSQSLMVQSAHTPETEHFKCPPDTIAPARSVITCPSRDDTDEVLSWDV